jgi:hypothetical protein
LRTETAAPSIRRTLGNLKSTTMQIGILGGGNVGSALARLALAAGHDVRIGQRAPRHDDGLPVTDPAAACAHGEVVILAIPFTACGGALGPLAPALAGKIVVDATNPLREDWSPLPLADADSAAQHLAALLPGARMVKAFNTVFADVMTADGLQRRGGQPGLRALDGRRTGASPPPRSDGAPQHRHRGGMRPRHGGRLRLRPRLRRGGGR